MVDNETYEYINETPPNGVHKFIHTPHKTVFFDLPTAHKTKADEHNMKPTAAGVISICSSFFTLTFKHSSTLGVRTDRDGIIGLEALLGVPYRE